MGQTKDQNNIASNIQSGYDNDIQSKKYQDSNSVAANIQDGLDSNIQSKKDQDSNSVASNIQSGHDMNIQNKQNTKKHKCTYAECQAVFLRPSKLERHMRTHIGERPYTCNHPGCGRSYTNSSHLKRHLETHNLVKKVYRCTQCSMTISNFNNLKRHYKRKHSEDKKLSCQECGETFNKKDQLAKHQTKHFGPRIYKCGKCTKTYMTPARLKRHEILHENGYPCPVSECSEVFHKWLLLLAHRKEKHKTNYKCENCDKIFSYKYKLRAHSKIHSENRLIIPCPYDNCQKTYLFKYNLRQHVKIEHHKEKFYCDICSVGFTVKRNLIKHIQCHYEPKKKKESNKSQRKKRRDAGIPKKSMLTGLVGIKLPYNLEKMVMERDTNITNNNIGIS